MWRWILLILLVLGLGCKKDQPPPPPEPAQPGAVRVLEHAVATDLPICREILWAGCRFLWCERSMWVNGLDERAGAGMGGLAPIGPCVPQAENP
jgi:hypothetical protein